MTRAIPAAKDLILRNELRLIDSTVKSSGKINAARIAAGRYSRTVFILSGNLSMRSLRCIKDSRRPKVPSPRSKNWAHTDQLLT
jgi:hypothetical protein